MSMHDRGAEFENIRRLMTAALDGELSDAELTDLFASLRKHPDLEEEYRELKKYKEVTMNLKFKEPSEDIWQSYWLRVYNRMERGLGWILVSFGAIVLLTFGAIEFLRGLFADAGLPWYLKGAIFCLAAGAVILLISVLREKIFLHKSERYKDIIR